MQSFSFPSDTITVFDAPEVLTNELLASVTWGINNEKYRQDCYISEDSISPKTNFGCEFKYFPRACLSWAENQFADYLKALGFNTGSLDMNYWWNYYPPKAVHEVHTHVRDLVSGIWVLSDNEDSGTVFLKESYSSLAKESLHQIKVDTVKSTFIIFPSNLMHYTLPSSSDRYTAAFNCNVI